MYKKIVVGSFIIILGLIPGCKYSKYYQPRKQYLKKVFFAGPIPAGPATIFIHGTKESLISKMIHKIDYPLGVVPSTVIQASSILSRIAITLDKACPEEFNRENFYYYGWHGKLNFPSLITYASNLYEIIKYHKGPITIMTHSHGCSIALYLAQCAEQDHNSEFRIARLILLAPPVQVVTKHLAHAPVFKEVYTFYSSSDIMQVGDPQGLYWESYAYTPDDVHIPILSKRTFDPAPNIMQTRIMLDRQSPGHIHFMLARFIKHVPCIIAMVKERSENSGYEELRNLFTVNIPPCGLAPEFLTLCDIKGKYVPRSNYYKIKRKIACGELTPSACKVATGCSPK